MRPLRFVLAAAPLTAVLTACSLGGTSSAPIATPTPATTTPSASAPATTPDATPAPGQTDAEEAGRTTSRGTRATVAHRPTVADAEATVRSYLRREVGMRDPVVTGYRSTGTDTAEVTVRARIEGRLGPATVVSVRRLRTVWFVASASTSGITLDRSVNDHALSATAAVSGSGLPKGIWNVTVTQDRYGRDVVLGGDLLVGKGPVRGFAIDVPFGRPTVRTGSIIVSEDLNMGGGAVRAAMVRVRFAPAPGPSCAPKDLLPVLKRWFDDPKQGAVIVRADVQRCRGDYAYVVAVPRVNPPGQNQFDALQVFMQYRNGSWHSLDYGTDVGCDDGETPAVVPACRALGYRH